jgi:hypothetical protein
VTAVKILHAGCVLLGEVGILIRGPSGAGKSRLGRRICQFAAGAGLFARHVGDDRVGIEARAGRLIARPVASIAGRREVRGMGIVADDFEPAAVVRLVIDLDREALRMPEESALSIRLLGIDCARIAAADDETALDMLADLLCRGSIAGLAAVGPATPRPVAAAAKMGQKAG